MLVSCLIFLENLNNGIILKINFTFHAVMQLIYSLPKAWKKLFEINGSVSNNLLLKHQVIRKNYLTTLEKLNSREAYNIIITAIPHTLTSKR